MRCTESCLGYGKRLPRHRSPLQEAIFCCVVFRCVDGPRPRLQNVAFGTILRSLLDAFLSPKFGFGQHKAKVCFWDAFSVSFQLELMTLVCARASATPSWIICVRFWLRINS